MDDVSLCLAACSELWRLKSNTLYCIVELVLNNFIYIRVNTKSRDCFCDLFIEHSSEQYSKTGTHSTFTRCRIISLSYRYFFLSHDVALESNKVEYNNEVKCGETCF